MRKCLPGTSTPIRQEEPLGDLQESTFGSTIQLGSREYTLEEVEQLAQEQTPEDRAVLFRESSNDYQSPQLNRSQPNNEGPSHELILSKADSNLQPEGRIEEEDRNPLISALVEGLRLRSGKILRRRSKSVGANPSKLNLNLIKETISEDQSRENIVRKMVDHNKVSQLLYNNVPLFYGEQTPNLEHEVRVFIQCLTQVKECLTEDEVKIFLTLIPTRFRGRAFDILYGSSFRTLPELIGVLKEKFCDAKTYTTLAEELNKAK